MSVSVVTTRSAACVCTGVQDVSCASLSHVAFERITCALRIRYGMVSSMGPKGTYLYPCATESSSSGPATPISTQRLQHANGAV